MGWQARLPRATPSSREQLQALLARFPDRATYERWLEARQVPTEFRAHMEPLLPPALQTKGTV